MNFIKIDGLDLKAKSLMLLKKAKDNPDWLQNILIQFVGEQNNGLSRERSESTIPNYYKALKLFCEMNDIILNWFTPVILPLMY